jgi:hypothetical protein
VGVEVVLGAKLAHSPTGCGNPAASLSSGVLRPCSILRNVAPRVRGSNCRRNRSTGEQNGSQIGYANARALLAAHFDSQTQSRP